MNWSKAADMAHVIEPFILVVSVYFIWFELREQARFAKASNAQALVKIVSPFHLLLIQDTQVAKLYLKGQDHYSDFSEEEKFQYKRIIAWALNFYENVYIQKQSHLLDEQIYEAWDSGLERFLKKIESNG